MTCGIGPDEGGLPGGHRWWVGGWQAIFRDLHVAYAKGRGVAESCTVVVDLALCTSARRRPLRSQSTRQAAPRETSKIQTFVETVKPGKCGRCAYAPTMSQRKGPPGLCASWYVAPDCYFAAETSLTLIPQDRG